MSLSVPISRLRGEARALKRAEGIPLFEALNRVAKQEGYASWSLLVARASAARKAEHWERLSAGELLLVGSRRGHGKTRCALQIALTAMRRGRRAWFFSLENDPPDLARLFQAAGAELAEFSDKFRFDNTDGLCARTIIERASAALDSKSVVVIDYLQLLDQQRRSPELQAQLESLRVFARRTGCIVVLIAQIDRSFDLTARSLPKLEDVRFPNPVDPRLFDKALFLHEGRARLSELSA